MVGKGVEPKSCRIFQQCYLKCCKLQNLTPLNTVIPTLNGQVLDFCVDRIKYVDWPPILNALSCDLSLNSVSIRCRQQVKTVLEQIDCERLAKTVNKRAVILTNFMLSNLMEATAQLLSNTTLLGCLLFEGVPLRIPYLNPLCEAVLTNHSLQHLYLPRCQLGDAGCLAVCRAVRCLPNILTLDLSGCELSALGAGYIADLVKYQKIHRYSENWVHTLRYRLPELDAMAGLRRITLCANPQLGDAGLGKLLDVLTDDLWIKALDVQNCGVTEQTTALVMQVLRSNTTLVILDMRYNADLPGEALAKLRAALRENEQRGIGGQYSWLSNSSGSCLDFRSVKAVPSKTLTAKEKPPSNTSRVLPNKYANKTNAVKKERDTTELLEEQLQEEILHRQQLEELNLQLVDQMKQLKKQQILLWTNAATSSGSEQSFQASSRSGDLSSSSGSSSSVPIDQSTLSYIQQAFKDIYAFIKNNQCHGECGQTVIPKETQQPMETTKEEVAEVEDSETRANMVAKKAQSTHFNVPEALKNKTTKSAHLLGDAHRATMYMKLEMIEKQMGDMKNAHGDEEIVTEDMIAIQTKNKHNNINEKSSSCSSVVSDSSETLVCSPVASHHSSSTVVAVNPREALYSSSEEEDSS